MKLSTVKKLYRGDEVTWNDPDYGTCSRTFKIQDIEVKGDTITLTDEDGITLECLAEELS